MPEFCPNYSPSAKFLVHNVHTSGELKLSGNCLKASRPVLSFEKTFDQYPHYQVIKELLTQIFATPNHHPRSQPFVDHIFNFSIEDKRIWFRNYQIVDEESKKLEEIGPRMVLQPIKIFEGSFGGPIIYENADYVCPNAIRKNRKHSTANKYVDKVRSKTHLLERRAKEPITYKSDPIFDAVYGKDGEQGKKNSADEKSSETIRKSMVEVGRLKRQIESIRYSKKSKKPKL
uniref:Ribosome biogenesis protein BRX1 homolog n=1 Tax=Romanomermis culicivorax TaxID=13658 RepID=A0A915ICM5_ROMCU